MISIVIPLYNKEKYIFKTLNSILSQDFKNFEVIIVDDGSTDSSLEIISEFKDDRIKVISVNNGGVSSARNLGIKQAKYSWIALLDADDFWDKSYLTQSMKIVKRFPEIKIVATNYYKVFPSKSIISHNSRDGFVMNYFDFPCITSSSVIIKKDVFDSVGLFDTRLKYGEDQHLWFRIAAAFKVYYNDSPLVYYNMHDHLKGNSLVDARDLDSDLVSVIDDLEIYGKNWERFKYNYLLKYLRPYYLFDHHLPQVNKLLSIIPFRRKINLLYTFYLVPRKIVKFLYSIVYKLKYT